MSPRDFPAVLVDFWGFLFGGISLFFNFSTFSTSAPSHMLAAFSWHVQNSISRIPQQITSKSCILRSLFDSGSKLARRCSKSEVQCIIDEPWTFGCFTWSWCLKAKFRDEKNCGRFSQLCGMCVWCFIVFLKSCLLPGFGWGPKAELHPDRPEFGT